MELQEFLDGLQNVKGGPTQYTARCPAHDDRHNSLSVGTGEDGRILLRCHAGCETAAVLAALGRKPSDLFPAALYHTTTGAKTKAPAVPKKSPLLPPPSRAQGEVHMQNTAERAGGEVNLQNCKSSQDFPKFREVVYPYTLADGTPLFETVRLPQPGGGKRFFQRRKDESGKLVYNLSGVQPVLYRLPALRDELEAGRGAVYVCEGEKDADILAGLGLCATTSPMGAGKWRAEYTDMLSGARMVTVLPDNDKPGRAHGLAVAGALSAAGIPVRVADLRALHPALPPKGDVADAVAALGAAAFLAALPGAALEPDAFAALAAVRDVEDEAPAYRFDTAADYLRGGFWQELARNALQEGLSTGFSALDRQLDGRMFAGLYVVGSVSSLGKTAFCLQMADAIAAQGTDVLFFSLEMSRLEMVGRSIVRQAFVGSGFNAQYSVGHLLHGKLPKQALEDAARAYEEKIAAHISFIEGGFDLDVEAVRRRVVLHHASTGRRPVVFVDYLQILRPPDMRMSDKQATDHNVVELKRLSRALDVPVVAVSSFNRQNYAEEVNMASFKESGAIEYSADFVLGLQARGISNNADDITDEKRAARMVKSETKNAKKQDPRPIEAVTLKNRRGPAWACFELDFYPRQNFFAETGRAEIDALEG